MGSWHCKIGSTTACMCGMALAESGATCSARTREEARENARKLKRAGWVARVVRGQCPSDAAWGEEREEQRKVLREEKETTVEEKKEEERGDPTENIRRKPVTEINSMAGPRMELEAVHGQVWDTDELQRDFIVKGFMAPFVIVTRKSDGVTGTCMFQHHPRFYFAFTPDKA